MSDAHVDDHRNALGSRLTSPFARAGVALIGTTTAVYPVSRVLHEGPGFSDAVLVATVMFALGIVARGLLRTSKPLSRALIVILVQAIVLGAMILLRWFRESAVMGIIPTSETLKVMSTAAEEGLQQIVFGVAPLPNTPELLFLLFLLTGVLAITLEVLTVHSRLQLVASALIVGIGAIPSIIVKDEFSFSWFVICLAISCLMLWQGSTAAQHHRATGLMTAASLGALAIAVTVAIAPLVTPAGIGVSVNGVHRLDPTLNLGEDLRRSGAVTALTLTTQTREAPYLRIATLTSYDGDIWHPDAGPSLDLNTPVPLVPGVTAFGTPEHISVDIHNISGSQIPVPYPITEVRGLTGEWETMVRNGTVFGGDIIRQSYEADYVALRPTLAQMQSATSGYFDEEGESRVLPDELPSSIHELAAAVTAEAATDVDRLLALQAWFRSEFDYSLQAPVDDDFDGTGIDAVEQFLQVREGYCIHFASSFALMARTLGMPTRVVVGFLPGDDTEHTEDGTVFTVSSDQLHAWPEVHFDGLGWIAFEPTASLGEATQFSETFEPFAPENEVEGELEETPNEARTPELSDPEAQLEEENQPGAQDPAQQSEWLGMWMWLALGILVIVMVPAGVRTLIGMKRLALATQGDSLAAWQEIQSTLIDLGIDSPDVETPRARGVRLREAFEADPEQVNFLVAAIEQASYAQQPQQRSPLNEPVKALQQHLRVHVGTKRRVRAFFMPTSLLARDKNRTTT